ncbi:poly(A) polymerase [Sulfuritortus calidifontis]|uniref:Poly(A) polymerase I n=1 Tax=Sulfuritortus calidifontis TaxID=1914471 RepID=A0A4R3K0T6_9PROT|nr:polynucleotide adenylyltransferase PcnB [Sulfuritortus calidifontis]TCS73972.1 poly(A) polymerase [Sulfuritortus calidifontis]
MIRRLIRKVFGGSDADKPTILPLARHGIRREQIHPCALKVTRSLSEAGYAAFVVGGAVRDLLIGREPKDFDVATDATPEEVRRCFRRSRIIGRRFQIVHVYCGNDTIEVTTFRASQGEPEADEDRVTAEDGLILRDNVFGSQAEDAARRDFTVNALYYDPEREEIWDSHGGVNDAKKRILRMIGDPETRYREDPVRMLRAARFAAKLDFRIDPATRAPIARLAPLLERIPAARLFDEMIKLLLSGHAERGVRQLRAEGLHHGIFPMLDAILDDPKRQPFIHAALHDTDERVRNDQSASPAFLIACLLWFDMNTAWQRLQDQGEPAAAALFAAMDQVLEQQRDTLAFPRRFDGMIKEIWALQPRFEQRSGARPYRLLTHPRFRAGYDFLLIRAKGGDAPQELADWWTRFQEASETERAAMLLPAKAGEGKRRRRPRKPRRSGNEGASNLA